jgi:hypothetical protein
MTKEIFDISMSLDEFVSASNVSREEPLGDFVGASLPWPQARRR